MFDGTLTPRYVPRSDRPLTARPAAPLRLIRHPGADHLDLDRVASGDTGTLLTVTVRDDPCIWDLREAVARRVRQLGPAVLAFTQAAFPFCPVMTPADIHADELDWLWDATRVQPGDPLPDWTPDVLPRRPGPPRSALDRALHALTAELHAVHRTVTYPDLTGVDRLMEDWMPDPDYALVLTLGGDETVPHVRDQLAHANAQSPAGGLPLFSAPDTCHGTRAFIRYRHAVQRAVPLIERGLHLIATPRTPSDAWPGRPQSGPDRTA